MTGADGLLLGLLLWLGCQGWMVVRLAREVRALARLQVALAARQQALDAAVAHLRASRATGWPPAWGKAPRGWGGA